ncbi:MAG: hypothetical protein IJ877_05800 [Candidatus Gastranaerophilales bacterium]|nr:hypothetical protein [Candidatus Gastranaerophilales bacterium]
MSKLNSDKIKFSENGFLVNVSEAEFGDNQISKQDLMLNRAQDEAQQEIEKAKQIASEIIEQANIEAENKSQEIINSAQIEADKILKEAQETAENIMQEANANKNELMVNAQSEIEKSSQEGAKKGYEEGYQDASMRFFEENEEKIKAFDEFCSKQNIVRDKILKNASREILNIIENISRNVLLQELNAEMLEKIIKNTIVHFDKKENITIILSEKYAKLLYELQKKNLDIELNFEDFKQYRNFNIIYNKELPDDTIIIENLQERFCASIEAQLNKIIREIHEKTKNGSLEIEEYDDTSSIE